MCDFKQGFKLCTCKDSESIDQSKPHWLLFRRVPRKDKLDKFIVGEFSIDCPEDPKLRQFILEALREGSCFDQDLNLKQKDKLELFTGTEVFSFELRRNGWQIYHPDCPVAEHSLKSKGKVEPLQGVNG